MATKKNSNDFNHEKIMSKWTKKKSVKYNQKLSTLLYILLYYTPRCMYYYYVCTQLLSWGPIRKHYWITHLTSPRGKMNSSKVRQGTTQAKPTCPFKKLQKWQTTPSGELLEHFFICLILCYKLCCCHNKWSYVAWW